MIYSMGDVIMNISDGEEIRYIMSGGIPKLDEGRLNDFMMMTVDSLVKEIYIHLSYEMYTGDTKSVESINKHFSDIEQYAHKARETMVELYKRDFSSRSYRHYIALAFKDLEDVPYDE